VKAKIAAIEYALPKKSITNEDLDLLHPDWSIHQVAKSTGVMTRYVCAEDQTALDLAVEACDRLFARGVVAKEDVGAVLVCTQSPDYIMPPNSTLLQHRLQLPQTVAAFDYSLACSGFIYGLFIGKAMIESDSLDNILLVASEAYSKKIAYPGDRGAISVIGDGAAVALLSKGQTGMSEFILGTDGSGGPIVPAGGARTPASKETSTEVTDTFGNVRTQENIYMEGTSILTFLKKQVPICVKALLDKTGFTYDDISLFIFHQASGMALDFLEASLKLPKEKTYRNLDRVGNTVSASIPIAIRDAELEGRIKPGDRLLVAGFGAGYSWGACIVDW